MMGVLGGEERRNRQKAVSGNILYLRRYRETQKRKCEIPLG